MPFGMGQSAHTRQPCLKLMSLLLLSSAHLFLGQPSGGVPSRLLSTPTRFQKRECHLPSLHSATTHSGPFGWARRYLQILLCLLLLLRSLYVDAHSIPSCPIPSPLILCCLLQSVFASAVRIALPFACVCPSFGAFMCLASHIPILYPYKQP